MPKKLHSIALALLFGAIGCGDDTTPSAENSANAANAANAENSANAANAANAENSGKLDPSDPAYCGSCHVDHYEDWQGSMHAYATEDPVFRAMLAKGINDTKGGLDQFCIQCHAPTASKYGLTPIFEDEAGNHTMPLDMENPLIGRGVVCVTCHQMESITATLNAGFTLNDGTFIYGPTGSNMAGNAAHRVEKSDNLTSPTLCGTCHNVVNPKGTLLENTFSEWYESEFADGVGDDDKDCGDCHMPKYEGEIVDGVTTEIHRHTFVGVDLAFTPDFPDKERQYQLVEELLRSAVDLEIRRTEDHADAIAVRVDMTNINNGHALPSGSTADRQVWVHLIITDSAGEKVYESGMFDANGDLMDRIEGHSLTPDGDPELLMYGSFLFNEEGDHVTFPWEAARSQNVLLQPGQTGWREYLIPREGLEGETLTVQATVKYRTFPPFLVRKLEEEGWLQPGEMPEEIPVVDMAEETIQIVVN